MGNSCIYHLIRVQRDAARQIAVQMFSDFSSDVVKHVIRP